ncbi:CRISPR-associated helicase/endonuclease Cas3 [Catellatospora sp. TT07R-123]|uniref:CRISPR-associated helicase Cas3' n=1 Tax=Catellatospora sp. TT07R-123 TaxID=2733863 RepID=UPI001B188A8E|nr:CRISPR-associated helicase Cas3' [Catellatospora sp. TT07R-123]GHJ47253.1 CRISPR-associated helicase/endonuclease Cas3 [Catellatospora sp. TT07R-123]
MNQPHRAHEFGPPLTDAARSAWGKTDRKGTSLLGWLPLWRHLADSADVAGRLWDHWLSPAVRRRIARELPAGDADGRILARWLAGIHDVGKATPAFAIQAENLAERMRDHGLHYRRDEILLDRAKARHEYAGHVIVANWLQDQGWQDPNAYAVVVGGHHGSPPSAEVLRGVNLHPHLLGNDAWTSVQHELLGWMTSRVGAADRLGDWRGVRLSQPVQAALTGLVIVADWLASAEEFFPYHLGGSDSDRLDTGWEAVSLPSPWRPAATPPDGQLFAARFELPAGAVPRPVQHTVADLAETMPVPGMMIVEAPMGEGKTEAALAAVEILARRTGASGCFVALPTRATSDAMFSRVLAWLRRLPDADPGRGDRDVRLAHGKAAFNPEYDDLRRTFLPSAIAEDEGGTAIGVHDWLAGRKRVMLSSFVIGTVDQLLFAALRAKHLALRHLGLAGKIVVVDEAHAYDVYMSQFLDRALEWLGAYGVPVIVLSATLPAQRRAALLEAYDRGRLGPQAPLTWRDRGKQRVDHYADLRTDQRYPLVTTSAPERGATATPCPGSGRDLAVTVRPLDDDLPHLTDLLRDRLADGGCALVIRNTVARVQETAAVLRAAYGDEIAVSVAHSRFMAADRARKDRWLRDTFGPPGTGTRPHRHIVVASQVAEQSLDIDFDLLVTDLAPVDLILQRMGRLHRHARTDRPTPVSTPTCWITGADWTAQPPQPVPGSRRVYDLSTLLRSAAVLQPHLDGTPLRLPDDIAPLTQLAYSTTPVGPPDWQPAMPEAWQRHLDTTAAKETLAKGFRLAEVGEPGTALTGWVTGGIGNAADHVAAGHVRDTGGDTLEVLLLVRTSAGLVIPPWTDGGGTPVPTDTEPRWPLPKQIARCTLPLPQRMTGGDHGAELLAELERRGAFPAWQDNQWLSGELVLDVDTSGRTSIAGFDLHYDLNEGLLVNRAG